MDEEQSIVTEYDGMADGEQQPTDATMGSCTEDVAEEVENG